MGLDGEGDVIRRGPGWFALTPDGQVAVHLGDRERELIATVMDQTRIMILEEDPRAWRLFPETYADEDQEEEYSDMVGDDLRDNRLAAIATVTDTLDADEIDGGQLDEWIRAVNAVRLIFGTVLDVDEDTEDEDFDPESPESVRYAVYHYLSALLDAGVSVLSELDAAR